MGRGENEENEREQYGGTVVRLGWGAVVQKDESCRMNREDVKLEGKKDNRIEERKSQRKKYQRNKNAESL